MMAYAKLTGRTEQRYRDQLLRFIPPLDRTFLRDFYEKQAKELDKQRSKAGASRKR